MPTPIELVSDFCNAWSETVEDIHAAIHKYFLPETIWDNVGKVVTTGPQEAITLWNNCAKMGFQLIKVDMLHIAAAGNVVMAERIDHLMALDGTELVACRLMSVFETDGEKILVWRDYTDPTAMDGLPANLSAARQTMISDKASWN